MVAPPHFMWHAKKATSKWWSCCLPLGTTSTQRWMMVRRRSAWHVTKITSPWQSSSWLLVPIQTSCTAPTSPSTSPPSKTFLPSWSCSPSHCLNWWWQHTSNACEQSGCSWESSLNETEALGHLPAVRVLTFFERPQHQPFIQPASFANPSAGVMFYDLQEPTFLSLSFLAAITSATSNVVILIVISITS